MKRDKFKLIGSQKLLPFQNGFRRLNMCSYEYYGLLLLEVSTEIH